MQQLKTFSSHFKTKVCKERSSRTFHLRFLVSFVVTHRNLQTFVHSFCSITPVIISLSLLSLHNYINWLPCFHTSYCQDWVLELLKKTETQRINYPVCKGSHPIIFTSTCAIMMIGGFCSLKPIFRHTFLSIHPCWLVLVTMLHSVSLYM